jgi:DNA-binding NarL/FixJ family response regulator
MPAKILIVDDHEIVREGIRILISRSRPEWEICGEATNGEEGIEACRVLKPDVVVLDVTMPRMSGLETSAQITRLDLGCRVLIFTMHESERLALDVRQAGAQGFVLKSQAARDLIRAIDLLLKGGTFFGSEPSPEENEPDSRRLLKRNGPAAIQRFGAVHYPNQNDVFVDGQITAPQFFQRVTTSAFF